MATPSQSGTVQKKTFLPPRKKEGTVVTVTKETVVSPEAPVSSSSPPPPSLSKSEVLIRKKQLELDYLTKVAELENPGSTKQISTNTLNSTAPPGNNMPEAVAISIPGVTFALWKKLFFLLKETKIALQADEILSSSSEYESDMDEDETRDVEEDSQSTEILEPDEAPPSAKRRKRFGSLTRSKSK